MSIISAAKFESQLRRWEVNFFEHSRMDRCLGRVVPWSQHEARSSTSCATRGPWNAHGIAIHHTGGLTSWQYVWDGEISASRRVPGPLYTVEIYEDGVAHLTGWGVTNNVGSCDKTIRDRVLAGKMPTSGGNVSPGGDDYSLANREFYGISYRGTAPNAKQRKTALLICAAICEGHGPEWDGGSIAGHKELTRRKPDPAGENMSTFRADVNKLLAAGPGGSTPSPPKEDDMTPAEAEAVFEKVLDKKRGEYTSGLAVRLSSAGPARYSHMSLQAAQANGRQLGQLAGQVAGLTSAVAQLAAAPGQPVDLDAVKAAAQAGAEEALSTLDVTIGISPGGDAES